MSAEFKVGLFLLELQTNFEEGNCIVARRKDEKVDKLLRELTWTRTQMFEYLIENLKSKDYIKGPEDDHNNPLGNVWVFIKDIEGKSVYIKISNFPNGSKCISFHENEK